MPEKFENDYTKEIDRLREDKRVLLEGAKELLKSCDDVAICCHGVLRSGLLEYAVTQAERPLR